MFLAAYYRFNNQTSIIEAGNLHKQPWSIRNKAMYLVDSDFDTEDDNGDFNSDGSSVDAISNQVADSVGSDKDDLSDNFFTR